MPDFILLLFGNGSKQINKPLCKNDIDNINVPIIALYLSLLSINP